MHEENLKIALAIIMNQLCIEANEALIGLPVYKQSLKYHLNKACELLEKRLPEYNAVYEETEEFLQYTQSRIEVIVPQLAKLRLDELVYVSHFLELYNKDHQEAVEMLAKGLKTEIR